MESPSAQICSIIEAQEDFTSVEAPTTTTTTTSIEQIKSPPSPSLVETTQEDQAIILDNHLDNSFYEKENHTAINDHEYQTPTSEDQETSSSVLNSTFDEMSSSSGRQIQEQDEEESLISPNNSTVPTILESSTNHEIDEIKETLDEIVTIVIRDKEIEVKNNDEDGSEESSCFVEKQLQDESTGKKIVSESCEDINDDNLKICHRLLVRLNRVDEIQRAQCNEGASDNAHLRTSYESNESFKDDHSVFSNDQIISKKSSLSGDTSDGCLLSPVVSRIEYTDRSIDESIIEGRSPLKNRKIVVDRFEENEELRVESGGFSSGPTVVQKLDKEENYVSRSGVIARLEENEEVVFSNSLIACMEDTKILDVKQANSFCADEVLEMSNDTETETETDSSEMSSSVVNIRLEPCDGASDREVIANQDKFFPCDEVNPEIINRLESERPEAFTEDSAESLTLASGSRDEVRSDGSDSGLGSEIPGDPGAVPALESDSEISFLDRIPDEILTDKDKVLNQLETFVPNDNAPDTPQTPLVVNFRSPPKSSLKRRLTDCMEGEPNSKRSNTEEAIRKKRNIHFDAVTVYYFQRAQGFTCVPSQGGSTLGMSALHIHAERFSLTEHAAEQRRIHRARLTQLRSQRTANCVAEAASSFEDQSDDTDEEHSDTEELDIDSYYFLQPVSTSQRRALLRTAGVRRIDSVERDECREIRSSREHCGCGCKGYCDPESCPCSRANVKCQVDRAGFPCGCTRDGCANSSGRIEFNPVRVRTHFIHTLMRLELEKKQCDEENVDQDMLDNQNIRGPLREISLGSVMENANGESCINGGGFTTLHYDNHDGVVGVHCQPEVPGTREDSLDLYAIRDDCYPSENSIDGPHGSQRKLHPEFSQTFQTFPGQSSAVMSFQQSPYQDYPNYANLPSSSRTQFQPQFQSGNLSFSHYAAYNQPETGQLSQGSCQIHQTHTSVYETSFSQDENTSQYTNLNSVQPLTSVVQQIGKLEPFSELLSSRYSYYGEMEPQQHSTYHDGNGTKVEIEKTEEGNEQQSEGTEECDENFGEIIKKSMVETVSA